ncbi:SUKH-3 domain-containing protein [Actinosynnema sp. NPDC059797]
MGSWSAEAEQVMLGIGWAPGRRVDTTPWREAFEAVGLSMHEAAERFLAEFGGLVCDVRGPGLTAAREPFDLDPLLAEGEEDRFQEWGEEIGRSIFPVGELDHGRFFLGIDENEEIYLVADWLARFGAGRTGLENLVLGVMPEEVVD